MQNTTQLILNTDKGTFTLPISAAQSFIDGTTIAERDIAEALQAVSDSMENPQEVDDLILAGMEDFKKRRAEFGFTGKIAPIQYYRAVARYAALFGYGAAMAYLRQVQIDLLDELTKATADKAPLPGEQPPTGPAEYRHLILILLERMDKKTLESVYWYVNRAYCNS